MSLEDKLASCLREILELINSGKMSMRICCNGNDCGCMGSTYEQQAVYYAELLIAEYKENGGQK